MALTEMAHVEFFASCWGEGWEKHVCMMPEDTTTRDASLGKYISEKWPSLNSIPKCPDLYSSLGSNPNAVAEKILETNPDLVILPGATMAWLEGLEGFYKLFSDSEVPVFNSMFYTSGLTETVAGVNYGSMGKILQKEETCNKIVKFHDDNLASIKAKLQTFSKTNKIYYEIPGADAKTYGSVVNMGVPEIDFVGTNVLSGVPMDSTYNIEKMTAADPDWIFLVDTSYYSGEQNLGYFINEDKEKFSAALAKYTARDGWSDLDAVKDKHVVLVYGELRFSVTSLYNLVMMVNILDNTVVTDEELDQFAEGLSAVLPWAFEGSFFYVME